MKTECCYGDCQQGRTCPTRPISEHSIRASVIRYAICSIAAIAMAAIIGAAQTVDELDAQTMAIQVMACSEHPDACREFFSEPRHATNTAPKEKQ
jgi:hypothetical protein